MNEQGQYARYQEDSKVLAAIGACLDAQLAPITVRLPKTLARAAAAALRDQAGELALIGLVISERGRWESDEVVVDLDVAAVGAAVRAAR
ncbi:hypothetical protein ACFWMR_38475 [Amycolatopsis thailandensis]|uniref:hypothetical protein n=1 Tax=Amycolatopsis thailandensis TaxID=589330 RepID=UPI0036604EC2